MSYRSAATICYSPIDQQQEYGNPEMGAFMSMFTGKRSHLSTNKCYTTTILYIIESYVVSSLDPSIHPCVNPTIHMSIYPFVNLFIKSSSIYAIIQLFVWLSINQTISALIQVCTYLRMFAFLWDSVCTRWNVSMFFLIYITDPSIAYWICIESEHVCFFLPILVPKWYWLIKSDLMYLPYLTYLTAWFD